MPRDRKSGKDKEYAVQSAVDSGHAYESGISGVRTAARNTQRLKTTREGTGWQVPTLNPKPSTPNHNGGKTVIGLCEAQGSVSVPFSIECANPSCSERGKERQRPLLSDDFHHGIPHSILQRNLQGSGTRILRCWQLREGRDHLCRFPRFQDLVLRLGEQAW